MVKKTLLTIFVFLLFCSIQYAQEKNTHAEFDQAVKFYELQKYDESLLIFNQILNDPQFRSVKQPATIFKAKILIENKKYYESEKLLKEFLKSVPEGQYRDEARLTLANNLYEQSFYYPAFIELIRLLQETESLLYKKDSEKYSELIALNHISAAQMELIADTSRSKLKPYLLLLTGKLYSFENRSGDAKKFFSKVIRDYPHSTEAETAGLLLKEDKSSKSGKIVIALLLPLSRKQTETGVSSLAWEVLEGVKYATDEFNKSRANKIGLLVRTILDTTEIRDVCDELLGNESVKVVLGPIFSSEVRLVLEELNQSDIPVISPTATDDGLIEQSNIFFQANPSFSQRGKIMANFIYYVEGKKRVAVINSVDGYSPIIASAFIDEFNRLGGKVLFRDTFKYNKSISLTGINKLKELKNSLNGLFIPLSDRSEAPFILSQLVQNEIDMPLYGNQDWMLAKGFETSTTLSNKLTFTSDYFIDYNDPDYQNFSREFVNKTNMEINRNVLYGYDAAKYLLTVIENTLPERTKIRTKMESGMKISGYHNQVSFNSQRINRNLNIIRYNNGIFELIERYELK